MTNAQTGTLVFKDSAGDYFLLPQETLEQGRVPTEHTAKLERLIEERGAGGDDVQGYYANLLWGLGFVIADKMGLFDGVDAVEMWNRRGK